MRILTALYSYIKEEIRLRKVEKINRLRSESWS